MRTRIIAILIVLAFIGISLPNNHSLIEQARADNLAGDLDQFPENEEMLDLSDGEYDYETQGGIYRKNNTYMSGIEFSQAAVIYRPPENLFDGTHASVGVPGSAVIWIRFSQYMRITRIRMYPMDNDGFKCDSVRVGTIAWVLNNSDTDEINDKTDFLEFAYNNLIIEQLSFRTFYSLGDGYLNEIEIYYDKFFNPYHYTSEVNYNYTNITNEFNNDTYINDTYVNDTYLNVTYDNTTYQNDTYTGITYQNVTYLNVTNQTGGEVFYNTTNEFVNYTYLNETLVQDNKVLEDKLNEVWKELNESKGGEATKDSKSLADKTYSDPILIILLLAILVFQFILFLQRKRNRERDQSIEKEAAIEPEIEHTPGRGLTKETDIDIISRNVQQGQAPQDQYSTPYHQYQHKPAEPPTQQPQSSSLAQTQQTEMQTPSTRGNRLPAVRTARNAALSAIEHPVRPK